MVVIPSQIAVLSWRKALHRPMKLWAMLCRATQDGWVIAASSDQMGSTGGGNGKPPQYTCHENLMDCIKRTSLAEWSIKFVLLRNMSIIVNKSLKMMKNELLQLQHSRLPNKVLVTKMRKTTVSDGNFLNIYILFVLKITHLLL